MKIWTIAWKDTLIRFRDRNALIMMLAAPLIISAITGAAFGDLFSNNGATPIIDIPLIIVNDDEGEFGQTFTDILTADSGNLANLLNPTVMADLAAAREVVQRGDSRVVVYIPANFTEVVQGGFSPAAETDEADPAPSIIQLYTDPSTSVSPSIVEAIVTQIATNFNQTSISGQVTIEQLLEHITILGPAMADAGTTLDEVLAANTGETAAAADINTIAIGESEDVNPFVFFVPSMGIFFLAFTMIDGTRSILDEDREGTLDRLISTPTTYSQILAGKIGGVFLTGILQFTVYMLASRLIFGIVWSRSPIALIALVLALVMAFTSLGAFIAAFARDATQANIFGSVVAILLGMLGGNFISADTFPAWLDVLSKFTINRWGLEGFLDLTLLNLGLPDILPEVGVLLGMGLVFFTLGLWQFQRRIAR